jgi:phosphoesterase RecJ-like protein
LYQDGCILGQKGTKTMWDDVAAKIQQCNNFVLTTHINPEGDAIGSEIALAAFLEDIGKTVTIVNSSVTPQNSVFMDPAGEILVYPEDYSDPVLARADVVIIVDVNNWSHLGGFAEALRASDTPRVCIDHHQGSDDGFAEIIVSDTTAAAAGVLVYELIKHMGGEITPRIAEAVYAAVITDTGTFRFSNTDARVFKIATELTHSGVSPFVLHRHVFSRTPGAVKLLGSVLNTLDNSPDGKFAWIHVTHDMFKNAGADYEDSDGLLDIVRSTKGVEFCIFFKELPDGNVKASLRSNGRVDVYEIARRFGGGGHRMASGMSLNGPIHSAIRDVVAKVREYIPSDG